MLKTTHSGNTFGVEDGIIKKLWLAGRGQAHCPGATLFAGPLAVYANIFLYQAVKHLGQ